MQPEPASPIPFGMTDCPIVQSLLESGALQLDYLEVHGPYVEDACRRHPAMPMLLHNALYQWSLAHPGGLAHMDAACLSTERLRLARSPWYSLHLGFSAAEVDFFDDAMQALSPVLAEEVILERCLGVLHALQDLVEVPLLVENMDYNPGGAYESVCRPAFIRRVLEESGAGLLLDLAHARVSAAAFGMDVRAYLDQLPLERVRQVHLNRPGIKNGRLVDSHEALMDEDYLLLEEVLACCQPWALTLEFNRAESDILEMSRRLRRMLSS